MEYIDTSRPELWAAAAAIAFNPIFWNIAAQSEYHNHTIRTLFGNNAYRGCYALAVAIFTLGIARDTLYERALRTQPVMSELDHPTVQAVAVALFASGNILVLSSMWALGVTGTYLGDYFGILMDAPVTGFPFNVTSAPMYHGSTMSFLATALWMAKPAGILLTVQVFVMYSLALRWEDPFTSMIYAKRDEERRSGVKTRSGKSTGGGKKEL